MAQDNAVREISAEYLVAADDVPVGYKKTEVGVIPEDWEVSEIGFFNPFVTSGSRGWAEFYSAFGDLFVRITNLSRASIYLDQSDSKYVSLPIQSAEGKRTQLEIGDVLVSITADIGMVGYVDESVQRPAYINQHIALMRFTNAGIDTKFLAYFLASESIQKLFRGGSDQGAKAGMNLRSVRALQMASPGKEDQTAIATALSDVDALITSLEKLIAKKQSIKTATMQQLLTGKTRLPQFALRADGTPKGFKQSELGEVPEDWEISTLGAACDFLDGKRRPIKSSDRSKIGGDFPYYGASGIVDYVNDYIFDGEFILLGEDGENILSRSLPLAFKVSGKIWVNNHAHVLKPVEEFHIGFLTEYLESLDYSDYNSGTAQPKLNKKACENLLVVKPGVVEQTAIASILSDMDTEIQTLQQRLHKTRQIKQGMMQELLTGKTRLI